MKNVVITPFKTRVAYACLAAAVIFAMLWPQVGKTHFVQKLIGAASILVVFVGLVAIGYRRNFRWDAIGWSGLAASATSALIGLIKRLL
jgi:hypothetical protein